MVDKKYCPLFTIAASALKMHAPQECMKWDCAWWVGNEATCVLITVVREKYKGEKGGKR